MCGDVHGRIDSAKLNTKNWPEQKELTKDDYLIPVGDFGMLWCGVPDGEEKWLRKWYGDRNYTTLFVDGNHENHERLQELERVEMFGGIVGKVSDSIYHLRRGEIYTIEDKKIFVFGGAQSIDKAHRKPHVSWWPGEVPSYAEQDYAIENLNKHNNEVDFILTHTCPDEIGNILMRTKVEDDPTSKFLTFISQSVIFKQWHFGHFHMDKQISSKYYIHYNNKPMRII